MIDEYVNTVPDPITANSVLGEPVSTHPVLASLKEQIASLEVERDRYKTSSDNWSARWSDATERFSKAKDAVKELLTDAFNDGKIEADLAEAIADALDIEITKTISISGAVNWSGTVEVSIFQDLDDVSYEVSVDNFDVSVYGEYVSGLDYDVEDVNVG